MGRTIHYGFKVTKDLPKDTITKLLALTKEYQEKYVWTCETVGFSNFEFYPNWERFRRLRGEDYSHEKIWEEIDQVYKSNKEKYNLNDYDNSIDLKMRHLINFHQENDNGTPDLKAFQGFTKVADNEFNALLVIMWLTEVSKLIPTAKISVYDEGDFLKLPIIIKNTKAIPDWKRIETNQAHCNKNIESSWAKENLEKMAKAFEEYNTIVGRPKNVKSQYVPVSTFTRQVNPKDFENHPEFKTIVLNIGEKTIGDFSQIMAGFAGEYWDKGKRELSEHRSQEGTEFIMNFLNGLVSKKEDDK